MASADTRRRHFRAPWGWKVWTVTVAAGGGLAIGFVVSGSLWVRGLLGSLLLGTLAFGVRSYSVQDGQVHVHRLGWRPTRFDLEALEDVYVQPGITMGSIMTFGNGGLFAFTGWFRNSLLGSYRAYATKVENAVVLDMNDGPVVVTPDDPTAFVEAVEAEREGEA